MSVRLPLQDHRICLKLTEWRPTVHIRCMAAALAMCMAMSQSLGKAGKESMLAQALQVSSRVPACPGWCSGLPGMHADWQQWSMLSLSRMLAM